MLILTKFCHHLCGSFFILVQPASAVVSLKLQISRFIEDLAASNAIKVIAAANDK